MKAFKKIATKMLHKERLLVGRLESGGFSWAKCDFVTNENGDFIQHDSVLVCKADDFSKLSRENVKKTPCSIYRLY